MSVNDLHWPEFKCPITIHLQLPDLKVITTGIPVHCVTKNQSDNSSSGTLMRSGRYSRISTPICSGSGGISTCLGCGGRAAGLGT